MAAYAQIVGTYVSSHIEAVRGAHCVLNIRINSMIYQADINILSEDGSNVLYTTRTNSASSYPIGINYRVSLSYSRDLHFADTDFTVIQEKPFYQMLTRLAQESRQIIINGMVYHDRYSQGIHDIHYVDDNHDGVIGFLIGNSIHWVYIKFQEQHLK